MPSNSPKEQHTTGESAAPQSQPGTSDVPAATPRPASEPTPIASDRAELLTRARTFLASPHVQLQDLDTKRAFLADKGVTPSEIDQLLQESPPPVPPRTYPIPPPSNLPNLLVGVARVFSWLTGTSAILLFIYYTFLLPRLARSYQARLALRGHQSALIARLAESASALKTTQTESYKDLPRTVPIYEDPRYTQCHSLDELISDVREEPIQDISDTTILRCALEELDRSREEGTSTEQLFRHLESKLPWLAHEEGTARQNDLWNQLNACSCFVSSVPGPDAASSLPLNHPSRLIWKYVPPLHSATPPLFASLERLHAALPRDQETISAGHSNTPPAPTMSARQRTLQVLSDFTGYITTQAYSLSLPSIRGMNGPVLGGSSVEDEVRREIRALKGLVLNRKSFLAPGSGVPGFASDSA